MHFVTCTKQGGEMEAVVLHRVGFLAYPCPKQGHDFKPSAAPLYPNMGQVPPPPPGGGTIPRGIDSERSMFSCRFLPLFPIQTKELPFITRIKASKQENIT